MGRKTQPLAPQFWAKVRLDEPDKCWLWTASTSKSGKGFYGRAWNGERAEMAHRVAYRLAIGPIPDGLEVCHACDNPLCCNPQHLWIGTHKQNMIDMASKARCNSALGSKQGLSKLTEADVIRIRERYQQGDISQRALGKQFGVSGPAISYIVNHQTWTHL